MNDSKRVNKINSALKQAGIEALVFSSQTLQLEELTDTSIARLHSFDALPKLPQGTGQCSAEDPALVCLRPGEWLALSQALSSDPLLQAVKQLAHSARAAVDDFTHGLAVFRLQGPGSPWLLGKLSGLDYLAGIGSGPHCAQTRMGHISVLVHYHQDDAEADCFDLIFDRSYARYLWELLCESSAHADDLASIHGHTA